MVESKRWGFVFDVFTWIRGWGWGWGDRLARFVSNSDEAVIEGVGDVSGISVFFVSDMMVVGDVRCCYVWCRVVVSRAVFASCL